MFNNNTRNLQFTVKKTKTAKNALGEFTAAEFYFFKISAEAGRSLRAYKLLV